MMKSNRFEGRTAVVTGAAKGIGAAAASLFALEGANVALLDIDTSGADLAALLGPNATFFSCDVSKGDQVKSTFSAILERFGGVDILVNNAGIQRYGTIEDTTEEDWDEVMGANLKSAFLCAHEAVPAMKRAGRGVVVNVSSVQAFLSQANVVAYTTSKTALLGLTRSIAVDGAPTVRCVAVCPGSVDTPMLRDSIALSPDPDEVWAEVIGMHPLERIATPEEVAKLIGFLSSDDAGFITGQAYRVDGGLGLSIPGSKRD